MNIRIFKWLNKPKSRTGYLRSKQIERRSIRQWTNKLHSSYGVKLVTVESGYLLDGFDLYHHMVTNGKRAAFDRTRATVYMRKGFTYYEIAHEASHAKHWHEIGDQQYSLLSDLEKETYVYEALILKAKNLTADELIDAKLYINRVRRLSNYPPLP
ncbi:MAG: hypothetical protein EOO61_14135 [Hymenobacter sp.]|nr:MAG: hypothetical protein EOO61_14135 [Hymenobacter sp.]